VAIPAFNEEVNIKNIILDVLRQSQRNFILKNITVYSDNSTDKTHDIVKSLASKNKILGLKKDKKRLGKYLRVSQACLECKSDILVVLDADIRLVGDDFLGELVYEMTLDKNALAIAAHQILIRPKGFLAKTLYAHFALWDHIRFSPPNQNIALNFYGSATAFRGSFARTLKIPEKLSDPHLYIYLKAAQKDGFRYSHNAEILQWPIVTLADFNKFFRRSLGKKDRVLEKMFNIKIEEVYFVQLKYKLIGILKSFWHEPFFTPFALLLILYGKHQLRKTHADKNAIWEILTSTKKAGTYEK